MSERVMFIASAEIPAEKKGAILADPKFDFLPHPTTLQPPTIKAPSKNKRTMLSTSPLPPLIPSSVFHTEFIISELKSK